MDVEINPGAQSYSVFIRERKNSVRGKREWYFRDVLLADLKEAWLTRFLEPFKVTQAAAT
jgi:hypothetical protein